MSHETEVGDPCPHTYCGGTLDIAYPSELSCSCHINPPCGRCTSSFLRCTVCGWTLDDDMPEPETREPSDDLDRFRRFFSDNPIF